MRQNHISTILMLYIGLMICKTAVNARESKNFFDDALGISEAATEKIVDIKDMRNVIAHRVAFVRFSHQVLLVTLKSGIKKNFKTVTLVKIYSRLPPLKHQNF